MSTDVPALQVRDVTFAYRRNDPVLRDISLEVGQGKVMCILGPSGSGKSTLLQIIAGLRAPDRGHVSINGKRQTDIPTFERNIGFVFQNCALFPHLSVYENVAFAFRHGNRAQGMTDQTPWEARVEEMLRLVRLESFRGRSVATLSGGQRQRVAVARALVYRPALVLFDEPLASLDNSLRRELLDLFIDLHAEIGNTFVYVTHDEREARRIGTHIAVIDHNHNLAQVGTVREVYSAPATQEVAMLMDDWNFIKSSVISSGADHVLVRTAWGDEFSVTGKAGHSKPGSPLNLGIRTADIVVSATPLVKASSPQIRLQVMRVLANAHETLLTCKVLGADNLTLKILDREPRNYSLGDILFGAFANEAIHVFH